MPYNVSDAQTPALAIDQPFASLLGLKKYETRGRVLKCRGEIYIYATAREVTLDDLYDYNLIARPGTIPTDEQEIIEGYLQSELTNGFPHNAIISVSNLTNVWRMRSILDPDDEIERRDGEDGDILISDITELEKTMGFWEDHRFAYELRNTCKFETPVPTRGFYIQWWLDDETIALLKKAKKISGNT